MFKYAQLKVHVQIFRFYFLSFAVPVGAFCQVQFGTQVRFRWSGDRNNRTAENAFSAPWYFSEMEFEPAAG